MSVIIVSDVFGVTAALLDMATKIGANTIVDPYEGKVMVFENEAEAYSCFMKTVGLDNYLSILLKAVTSIEHPITLIGFSVGASVVWRLSEIKDKIIIKQAICYYGSQIRHFTQIEPRFKVSLVWPISEPNFDVVALQKSVAIKVNVKTQNVMYLHGFMNYHSSNYNESAYNEHTDILCTLVS